MMKIILNAFALVKTSILSVLKTQAKFIPHENYLTVEQGSMNLKIPQFRQNGGIKARCK